MPHVLRTRRDVAGKAWWQEGEVAGHMVRKQRGIHVNAQISFVFFIRVLLFICVSLVGCVRLSSGAHRQEVSDALRKLEM